MIHIITDQSAGALLQHALNEKVIVLDYPFELGSLKSLTLPVQSQLQHIDTPIKFWYCDNARERTALYFLTQYLPIHLIKLMNVSVHLDHLDWEVRSTCEIGIDQAKLLNDIEPNILSKRAYQDCQNQWKHLVNATGYLRIMREQVCTKPEDYYDDIIQHLIHTSIPNEKGLIQPARIVGEMLGSTAQCICDSFFHERLKHVIRREGIEVEGVMASMRDYRIKMPGVVHFPHLNGLEYIYVEGEGPCKVILQPLDDVFIGYYYETNDEHFLMMNPSGVGMSDASHDERHLEDYARELFDLIQALNIQCYEFIAYDDAYFVAKQLITMYAIDSTIEHIHLLEDYNIEDRLLMASIKKDQSDEALLEGISIQSDCDVVVKAMMQNLTSRNMYEAAYKRLSHWDQISQN